MQDQSVTDHTSVRHSCRISDGLILATVFNRQTFSPKVPRDVPLHLLPEWYP